MKRSDSPVNIQKALDQLDKVQEYVDVLSSAVGVKLPFVKVIYRRYPLNFYTGKKATLLEKGKYYP